MKRALTTVAAVCILILLCERYYNKTIYTRLPILNSAPSDFLPYYQAAQHAAHGESPFLADGYIYPPLFALVLTPLTHYDYVTARHIWFAISQLFLIAAAILLWRRFGRDWVSACWILVVWAGGGAAAEALALGQVGPLLTFIVTLAITARGVRRGLAIAAGFAIKIFPGLLGVAVLLRRGRRASLAMIATAVLAAGLPWLAVATLFRGPSGAARGAAWEGTPATLSWSMPSLVLRVLDPARRTFITPDHWLLGTDLEHFRLPGWLAAAGLIAAILTLAIGLLVLVRATGWRLNEEQMPWTIAALTALALLASPVCWTHYQVLEYPGVALLLIYSWRQRRWLELAATIALGAILYPLPLRVLDAVQVSRTPVSVTLVSFWITVPTLATIGLYALFVRRAALAGHLHGRPRRSPVLPDYSRPLAERPLVHLHDGPRSPSPEVSSR